MPTNYSLDIRNFAYIVKLAKQGVRIKCPYFNKRSSDKAFNFHIYPKGQSCEDFISFYLSKLNPSNQTVYNCTLSIGRPDATPVKSYEYSNIRFLNNVVGEDFFLLKKLNSWILRGPIRFSCEITEIDPQNQNLTLSPSVNTFSFELGLPDVANLSLDLGRLLEFLTDNDLTVDINGTERTIHRYILYARCPNLSHEFGYSTIREMPLYVAIQTSVEIFELLMHYIYTGKLRDSYIPLELFHYAERLGLTSLMQCIHEQAYSCQICTETHEENRVISWNLDELEEDLKSVHILRTAIEERLAIQASVSDCCINENCVHISLFFYKVQVNKPILLVCKISLTSQAGLEAFKEEHHIFSKVEQWHFPCFPYEKVENNMCLTAELNISEGSTNTSKPNCIKTKIKLYTNFQTVTENLENLRSDMSFLYETVTSTSNLVLLSADKECFKVHSGIMWARWPGLSQLLEAFSDTSSEENSEEESSDEEIISQMELNLPSQVLSILLPYLYTGFISNFDREKAQILLKYSNQLEYPFHLVEKCKALLSNNHL